MARKKKVVETEITEEQLNAHILGAGEVVTQNITHTLETNFMPYAMSVIVSRAIPEIDGFKPSHRKLLYTMYKMGLLNGGRVKSANIVGRTMQLNPHGDSAIYETMVRLSRGNESLLHPYVDSKGNFGKAYSKNMAFAASRYTEAKLEAIASELFKDIDKDTVDFVDNYDATMQECSFAFSPFTKKKKMRYLSQNIRLGKLCCSKSSNHVLMRNINSGFASFAFLVLCSIIFKRQKVVRREGWFNKISLNSLVEFHRAV